MSKRIPTSLRTYLTPDLTWLPLALLILAVIPAMAGWTWPCLVLLVASVCASAATRRKASPARTLLELGGFFGPAVRGLRLAVLLLLGSQVWSNSSITIAIATCGIVMVLASTFTDITVDRLAARLIPEILTRNLNINVATPPLPARLLAQGLALVVAELMLIVVGCLVTDSLVLAWVGAGCAVLALAVLTLATDRVLRSKGNAFRDQVLADVQTSLKNLNPEVALYLGANDPTTVYQLESWLATAEGIEESTIVVVRSVEVFEALGKTSVPVIALVTAKDLLALNLSTLRAGLFVANTGDVIHLVREQNPMSAFIGHGDSDKNSSFNPFTKVYDEVWVAGKAGEDRYTRAQIGIRPDQFVAVGRPQLEAIDVNVLDPHAPGHIPTILYAPTWEGWNQEQEYCSLLAQGVDFVEQVLAHPTTFRLIFKPHPFTGIRNPKARASANKIAGLIRKSNSARGISAVQAAPKRANMATSAREANRLATEGGNDYFAKISPQANLIVQPNDGLGIFQCFEHSDALITDVSSVLSDFLITDRPFAVCNPRSTSAAQFVAEFPSAAGGYVVDRDGSNAGDFLDVIAGNAPDSQQQARRRTRESLLGPATPAATVRFNSAVTALIARANERITERG